MRIPTAIRNCYATLLALPTVYTPQIVVDGKGEAVGSDRADIERALDLARRDRPDLPVTLALDQARRRSPSVRAGAGWRPRSC